MRAAIFALLATIGSLASAQPTGHHGRNVLLLARADGREVRPAPVETGASATVAVLIDRRDRTLSYDLTFHGLETGAPSRIGLYNFGRGGVGKTVATICGNAERRCPGEASARLTGRVENLKLDPRLLSEFASGRIYVQIDSGDGRPELRGQLEPNGAMVPIRNFIAPLVPRPGSGGTGTGTAVLSETYLPGGRIEVEYSVTVAGTSGEPEAVSVGGAPQASFLETIRFMRSARLPSEAKAFGRRGRGGGSFSGRFVASTAAEKSNFTVSNFLESRRTPTVAVRTSRFPDGELVGEFKPVE